MLTGGTLGDRFGRKKVMLGGVAVFCAGSIIAALAPTVSVLIVGRVVMGVGAAASEPGTLSMIRHVYPDRAERARALGAWAAISGFALAVGPVIGGAITGYAGWRAVFWFNLGFGALALVAALWVLPENSDPRGRRLDVPGLVLGAAALVAGSVAVIEGESAGYGTWWIIALFAVTGLCAVGFGYAERHVRDPAIDLRFFRAPGFTGAIVVAFVAYFAVFAIFFFVALYLEVIASFSGYRIAAQFAPMTILMVAGSAAAGFWVARSGPRTPMVTGCVLAAAGMFTTDAVLGPQVGYWPLAGALMLAGLGFGLALVPVTDAALAAVPPDRSGMAASATNTSRELGAVLGVAVLGAIVNAQLTGHLVAQLRRLGIPAEFQSIVIDGVTHGGLAGNPAQQGQAYGNNSLVTDVINAAYQAFYAGLHIALILAGAMLIAAAIVAAISTRRRVLGPLSGNEPHSGPLPTVPGPDHPGT